MPLFRLRQIDYVLVIYRPPLGICIPLHASQVSVSHVISYLPVLGVSASYFVTGTVGTTLELGNTKLWGALPSHFFTASISVTVGDLDKASPVIRIASAVSVDAESLMASSIRVLTRLSNESPAYFWNSSSGSWFIYHEIPIKPCRGLFD